MKKLKIALFDRSNSKDFNGGDTVQIKAIARFLRENSYSVDIIVKPIDISQYDIIFIFNLQRPYESFIYTSLARYYKKPVFFFPIYWDMNSLKMKDVLSKRSIIKKIIPVSFLFFLKTLKFYLNNYSLISELNTPFKCMLSERKLTRYILDYSLFIIPNSQAEARHLMEKYGCDFSGKIKVVYNGTDIEEGKMQELNLTSKFKLPEDFICCVGGIGPRKNQLSLVKAARDTGINLVIVGKSSVNDEKYEKKIRSIASDNVYFLGGLTAVEVRWILKKAKGHIQPSYIETPGLSSLEALNLGCPIVVSDVAPVREYFKEEAFYCSPYSIESIKNAMERLNSIDKTEWKTSFHGESFRWNYVLQPILNLLNGIKKDVN